MNDAAAPWLTIGRPEAHTSVLRDVGHTFDDQGVQEHLTGSCEQPGVHAPDRMIVLVLPLNHVHGIVNVTLTPLSVGACCEAPGGFDAVAVWGFR